MADDVEDGLLDAEEPRPNTPPPPALDSGFDEKLYILSGEISSCGRIEVCGSWGEGDDNRGRLLDDGDALRG